MIEDLRNIYRYRQLITTLTSRDLKARYRGSLLGYFWSLANPLLLLGVYTLVFSFFLARPDVEPYPLFLFAGILPWTFFAGATLESTTAILSNAGLVKKVLFPAEVLPLVVVMSHLVHFVLAIPILLAAVGIARLLGLVELTPAMLATPVLLLLQTAFVSGIALMVASASVLFRDLRDLVANFLQLGFFLTPVIYPLTIVDAGWVRGLLRINPLTPFVIGYQSIFVFGHLPPLTDFLLMVLYASFSLWAGFEVFDRLRDTLAEAI